MKNIRSNNAEEIEDVLEELKNRTGALETHVVYRNGINLSGPIHVNDFAAMLAAIMGAGETALDLRDQGVPIMAVVHGHHSVLIIMPAGPKALLALFLKKEFTELGETMPLAAMSLAAQKIADIVK